MKQSQIAKAIAMTCIGTALSAASISTASAHATTMYNLYQENGGVPCAPCAGSATDGWVYGFNVDNSNPVIGWVGTAGPDQTPFGYNGGGALNWAVELHGFSSAEISNEDSLNQYGASADIDVAKGSWSDANQTGAKGWRHNLDVGIIKPSVSGTVKLSVQGVNLPGTNFGFTIFKGMDTSTGSYAHHGGWNPGNNEAGLSAGSLPGGGTSFAVGDIVAYSVGGATPSNLNNISFYAEAGQEYTVFMGGYRNGAWFQTTDGYALSVSLVSVYEAPIKALMHDVMALNLHHGIANALDSKLDNVLQALEDMNSNNDAAMIGVLNAFINSVEAQSGKKIPEADADALIADAQAIIDSMSM